jgi:disulfide oxidoreductase YuzD
MHTTDKKRWYDNHLVLIDYIEILNDSEQEKKDTIVSGMKKLIMDHDKEFFEKHLVDFPLPFKRWYYEKPFYWMVMNIFEYADEDLLTKIILYLSNHLMEQLEIQ